MRRVGDLRGRGRELACNGSRARQACRKALSRSIALVMVLAPTVASAQWIQLGADIDGETSGNKSGSSTALSADGLRVAVGSPFADGFGTDSGRLRVFAWVNSSWIQRGADLNGAAAFDFLGDAVAISADGTHVAAGATNHGGDTSGQVRVYYWHSISSQWIRLDPDIEGEAPFDQSGWSVSLSSDGSRVAIGAPGNRDGGTFCGQVRVFQRNGADWDQMGADLDGEAAMDVSGWSVAISSDGSRVAIGAPGNSDSGPNAGSVRIYRWSTSTQSWHRVGGDIDGESAGDGSGTSVALSSDGSRVAIGAPGNDDNGSDSGQVRVYQWSGSSWDEMGLDLHGEAAGDQSGFSVALSTDGSLVAIGAPANDANGAESGQVRVFRWSATTQNWHQVGLDLDGEAAGDASGTSVGVSSAGPRVAVGAPLNGGNGAESGQVRVYALGLFVDGFESGDTTQWSASVP